MKISFSRFKILSLKTIRQILASLLFITGILFIFNSLYALIPLGISFIFLLLPLSLAEYQSTIELNNVLQSVKAGFLGARLPRSNPDPVQEQIRVLINAALDETETTFIEMLGAMEAANTGRTWRRLQIDGLNGAFRTVLEKMQVLLDKLAASTEDAKRVHAEVEAIHRKTRDSIEYASIIQRTILPNVDEFHAAFTDSFAVWKPKDIVGGDIWFFEPLKAEGEYLLFVIDCTGHGVPGAFVTMLVKSIQRTMMIGYHETGREIYPQYPGQILTIFNIEIKNLLNQYTHESESNVGFDAGLLYINKKEGIIRFSGAETPLFLVDKNGKCTTIKGSRQSVGYRSSNEDFMFQDHEIKIDSFDKIYLTTDGLLDQNGGAKDIPFGKKRLISILEANNDKSLNEVKEIVMNELQQWRGESEQNDDITFVGIKI